MTQTRRKYNAERRRQQSRQTRRQILEAARAQFTARGYSDTTIEAIAQQAGVATETIYSLFGGKRAVLLELIQVTLTGDDQPTPLLQRPFIQEATRVTDPQRLVHKFATDNHGIMTRMSPMFALLRTTARSDPEVAAIFEQMLSDRLKGMSFFVEQLRRTAPLRASISVEEAAVTAWTLSSGEVFDLLIHDLGWTEERYIAWLAGSLSRLLLDERPE